MVLFSKKKIANKGYPLDLLPAQSDCCRSSFFNFFIFYFSLHSLLDGGIWFQTVGFGSVLECDWKMRFIVPKNHPERKRTSILVEWGRKKLKLIDFLSQSWSAQTNVVGCAHPFGSVASDAQNPVLRKMTSIRIKRSSVGYLRRFKVKRVK